MTLWLEDCGLKYGWLASEQIERGELKKYRALVLPYSQALSDEEAQAIREFVRNGGLLVADVRPGTCDEHGKRLERGLLDEVFGVRWGGFAAPEKPGPLQVAGTIGDQRLDGALIDVQADSCLVLAGAKASLETADGIPLVTQNIYGKGKAVLLNFLNRYNRPTYWDRSTGNPVVRGTKDALIYCDILSNVFESAGITPEVTVAERKSQAGSIIQVCSFGSFQNRFYITLVNWNNGDLLPVYEPHRNLTYQFDTVGHFYDVRKGRYLGNRDNLKCDLNPGDVHVWARLPYKVSSLSIKQYGAARRGKEAVFEACVVPTKGTASIGLHVFHVTLKNPSGQELKYYRQNLTAEKGQARLSVPLAYSDACGRWEIYVRDVATGITASIPFMVE